MSDDDDTPPPAALRYRAALARAPDCRDPDHPGCARCEGDYDEEPLLCFSP